MLSLGKLAPGQQQYYLDTVARGAEEYYTGAKEAPGQWVGAGAPRLGLTSEVDAEALGRVLDHVDPSGGFRLTAARSVPTVAGFDVTFCAPKSVSVLFALGAAEVSNEVRNAADAAVSASLRVLEQQSCRVRRGQGGHTVLEGDGFVAAAFRHRTSRAGDPHLHTHVVVANLAHSPVDDRWTALDARPLYSWLAPVGYLYEAHLRWELTRRLGVGWGPVSNGIADIAGVPAAVIREFSTRRRQIEDHLAEHGQHGARAAQVAAYATRRAKDTGLDAGGMVPGWRARAEALGLDAEALAAVVGRRAVATEPPVPASPEAEVLYRRLASPEGLTARASTFGERDVIKAVCNALPAGGRVEEVLGLVDGFLGSEHVVAVRSEMGMAAIRRADGTVVAARTDEARFTTPEMLAVEVGLVAAAVRRRRCGAAVADSRAVEAAVRSRGTLSVDQQRMVRAVCLSGDGIDVVEGVAGAGKTYALAVARDAWEASGFGVIGCSLAARAARQLQDGAGIPSGTIDRLLGDIDRRLAVLDATTVVVCDEAAMVGTRKLARLVDHAGAAGAKVVLVGDPCQLAEIDAGGAFRGLRARLGASVLTENRRQSEAWERDALAELRAGDPCRAIDAYLDRDRVHQASTAGEARDLLVEEWMNAWVQDHDVVMVAGRLADVEDLNRRARAALRHEGYLGDDQIVLGGRGFTEADEVLALRNDYRLGVLNGTRAVVERIDRSRRELVLGGDAGERLVVGFGYAEAGHLTHGYATTVHKAQGATVDRCLVLLDDTTSREQAYTALSRGRRSNDLYVVATDRRADERHATETGPDPLDELRHALGRSTSQRMALDHVDQPPASTLVALRHERDELRQQLGAGPPDRSGDHRWISDAYQRERWARDSTVQRLAAARRQLGTLGPIARRTKRAVHQRRQDRVAELERRVGGHDDTLAELQRQLTDLAPARAARAAWQHEHHAELDRVATLDRHIDLTERLNHATRPRLDRGQELDHGIEL